MMEVYRVATTTGRDPLVVLVALVATIRANRTSEEGVDHAGRVALRLAADTAKGNEWEQLFRELAELRRDVYGDETHANPASSPRSGPQRKTSPTSPSPLRGRHLAAVPPSTTRDRAG